MGEIVDGKSFVYNVGPEKFDDMLRASEAEVMRGLTNTILLENIYDLHGTDGQGIVDEWKKIPQVWGSVPQLHSQKCEDTETNAR